MGVRAENATTVMKVAVRMKVSMDIGAVVEVKKIIAVARWLTTSELAHCGGRTLAGAD